jgi:hypothetical protein
VQLHGANNPPGRHIFGQFVRQSEPLRQIVQGFLFGVGQPGQHPGGGFPGNAAVNGQVPHSVTGILEFAKDLGDQLGSRAVWMVIFDLVAFDSDPESKNSRHPELHGGLGFDRFRRCCSEISVPATSNSALSARAQLRDDPFRNNRSSLPLSST